MQPTYLLHKVHRDVGQPTRRIREKRNPKAAVHTSHHPGAHDAGPRLEMSKSWAATRSQWSPNSGLQAPTVSLWVPPRPLGSGTVCPQALDYMRRAPPFAGPLDPLCAHLSSLSPDAANSGTWSNPVPASRQRRSAATGNETVIRDLSLMPDAQLRGAQDAGATHYRRFSWWEYGLGILMRTAAEFPPRSEGRAEIHCPSRKTLKLPYWKGTEWRNETSEKRNSWPIASQQSGTFAHLCGTPVDGKLFETSTHPGVCGIPMRLRNDT